MANTNGSGRRELPRWLRLLAEKWRIADPAAAYPFAVPGDAPAETSPDRSDSSPSPPPPQDQSQRPT